MPDNIFFYIVTGFVAQLIDGALGMAYGVVASSVLLGMGLPPAAVSSTVHMAECFSTGASAVSHHYLGNIREKLFMQLVVPGVAGALIGAYVLPQLPGDVIKPYIAGWLLFMGIVILFKGSFRRRKKVVTKHVRPLGFFGALLDMIGSGGWGPLVATTLIARGNDVRQTIGSVNAAEFFVTLAGSISFFFTIGIAYPQAIIGLALGGIMAAPVAAWVVKIMPARPLMIIVGLIVMVLSIRTILSVLEL